MSGHGPLLPGGGHGARFDPAAYLSEQALDAGLAEHGALMDEATQLAAAARIIASWRAMKRDQVGLDAAWLPAGEWSVLVGQRGVLYGALDAGDVAAVAEHLASFWRNSIGPIVKEYATFDALRDRDSEPTRRFMHNVVRNWRIWKDLTHAADGELATPQIGKPWGYLINDVVVAPKACRYHLVARELAGMTAGAAAPLIAEIGGGYGGLAEFFLRRSPHAAWIDYDLPETAVIAAYFHIGARGSDRVTLYGEGPSPRTREDVRPGQTYVLPNYAMGDLTQRSVDAVVNMFSLSEVGPGPLALYLDRIATVTDGWFLHHNLDRAGVINRGAERIAASSFAIDPRHLALVSTGFDPFHGHDGDYRWFLYKRAADYGAARA